MPGHLAHAVDTEVEGCQEAQFGSYGIDVLASEAGLRRSNLYSIENGEVFKSNTWAIHKQTLHIGTFETEHSAAEVRRLVHQPDYLSHDDLRQIYHYDEAGNLSAESVSKLVKLLASKRTE